VRIFIAISVALLATWLALAAALLVARPRGPGLREALRLLPDTLRMLRGLATDAEVPRGVRVRLWLLLAYLAMPFDVIPDFVPVLGYADDAILAVWVLRSVVRRAGPDAIRRHWPGTAEGLDALARAARLRLGPSSRRPAITRPRAPISPR
jgi:uncharacterized membrane protein YkvA (DUF1232 family)